MGFKRSERSWDVKIGEALMKCPYCEQEMRVGSIAQDRYALKWVAAQDDKWLLNFTPLVKGIKLTAQSFAVKVFYCDSCRKFIIDQDDLCP